MKDKVAAQLVKSLSFEVEATPQENVIEVKNTPHMTPLNIKVRVRKKDDGPSFVRKGIIAIPRNDQPDNTIDRLRLASSDQTIMSFNILMEAELEKKAPKKSKRSFFGICLGVKGDDDDDTQYLPSETSLDKDTISDTGVIKLRNIRTITKPVVANDTNSSHSSRKKDTIFGKCKPGGCLDPPFGEDRYSYQPQPLRLKAPATTLNDAQNTELLDQPTNIFSKISSRNKKGFEIALTTPAAISAVTDSPGTDTVTEEDNKKNKSILDLYQGEKGARVEKNDSEFIITYPPGLSSSGLLMADEKNEKNDIRKTSGARYSRKSFNEFSTEYFSPPRTPRDSKDTAKSDTLNKPTTNEIFAPGQTKSGSPTVFKETTGTTDSKNYGTVEATDDQKLKRGLKEDSHGSSVNDGVTFISDDALQQKHFLRTTSHDITSELLNDLENASDIKSWEKSVAIAGLAGTGAAVANLVGLGVAVDKKRNNIKDMTASNIKPLTASDFAKNNEPIIVRTEEIDTESETGLTPLKRVTKKISAEQGNMVQPEDINADIPTDRNKIVDGPDRDFVVKQRVLFMQEHLESKGVTDTENSEDGRLESGQQISASTYKQIAYSESSEKASLPVTRQPVNDSINGNTTTNELTIPKDYDQLITEGTGTDLESKKTTAEDSNNGSQHTEMAKYKSSLGEFPTREMAMLGDSKTGHPTVENSTHDKNKPEFESKETANDSERSYSHSIRSTLSDNIERGFVSIGRTMSGGYEMVSSPVEIYERTESDLASRETAIVDESERVTPSNEQISTKRDRESKHLNTGIPERDITLRQRSFSNKSAEGRFSILETTTNVEAESDPQTRHSGSISSWAKYTSFHRTITNGHKIDYLPWNEANTIGFENKISQMRKDEMEPRIIITNDDYGNTWSEQRDASVSSDLIKRPSEIISQYRENKTLVKKSPTVGVDIQPTGDILTQAGTRLDNWENHQSKKGKFASSVGISLNHSDDRYRDTPEYIPVKNYEAQNRYYDHESQSGLAHTDSLKKTRTEKSEKDQSSRESIFLNLAFQKYLVENQMAVKTLDSAKNHGFNNVVIVKSLLRSQDKGGVVVPIDSKHVMNININPMPAAKERKFKIPKAVAKFDSSKSDYSNSTISIKDIGATNSLHSVLSLVLHQELVPLESIIKSLKNDIDSLAAQQMLLKDRIGQGSQRVRPARKCGCLKRII